MTINLATLEKLEQEWGEFINLRNKLPYKKGDIESRDPKALKNLISRLNNIIVVSGDLIRNKGTLFKLVEKLEDKAKKRFTQLLIELNNINRNAKSQKNQLS
ncbi:MAG: hypothetical protein KJ623_00070 [Nanoarchaeota archaeon]|nr:hypothetical protein [Nanoarchaeota archaeon]MBU0962362.1 hypothetical protein [Nanoarchaeota archaeon]